MDVEMEIHEWPDISARECAARLASGKIIILVGRTNVRYATEIIDTPIYSPAERERALRFHFHNNCAEFLFARGIVRIILGAVLGTSPEQVAFGGPANQKPRLITDTERLVDVSISHSHGWVACGFAIDRTIGVDIETEARPRDLDAIARYILNPLEWRIFNSLDTPVKRSIFRNIWCRKEAVLKAAGIGLAGGLTSLEVLRTGKDGSITMPERITFSERDWRLQICELAAGPLIALAVEEPLA